MNNTFLLDISPFYTVMHLSPCIIFVNLKDDNYIIQLITPPSLVILCNSVMHLSPFAVVDFYKFET